MSCFKCQCRFIFQMSEFYSDRIRFGTWFTRDLLLQIENLSKIHFHCLLPQFQTNFLHLFNAVWYLSHHYLHCSRELLFLENSLFQYYYRHRIKYSLVSHFLLKRFRNFHQEHGFTPYRVVYFIFIIHSIFIFIEF